MNVEILFTYKDAIAAGILMTLKMSLGGILLGLAIGLCFFLLERQKPALLNVIYHTWINVFRGTPLLVQLFLVFYGGPYIGINLGAQQVGVLCLGCYGSAYFSEIFRAGRNAVSGGQSEAAADLGLSPWQIFTFIVWPQMFARIIQPLIGQSVILVKESSVLSIITVGELTNTAMAIANQTYAMVEIYSLMAIVYWGIAIGISRLGNKIERHYSYSQLSRG
ncbi:amino acid ABC transporter permease [Klebsiella pneumoniae]|uniref:amino acid ABC transporter permease n=1 Tax=Klebsiella pneumoniae TaxID=573 RepID=UPI0027E0F626|nr:amino acid ABC transporter permease [Klebsiella pneumoniae]MDQ6487702.1 amino acid ABC transporter permease [Klebsiella pneumoniae]